MTCVLKDGQEFICNGWLGRTFQMEGKKTCIKAWSQEREWDIGEGGLHCLQVSERVGIVGIQEDWGLP